jgi:hypothetical protein
MIASVDLVLEELALVHAVAGRVAAPVEDAAVLYRSLRSNCWVSPSANGVKRDRLYFTFQSIAMPLRR